MLVQPDGDGAAAQMLRPLTNASLVVEVPPYMLRQLERRRVAVSDWRYPASRVETAFGVCDPNGSTTLLVGGRLRAGGHAGWRALHYVQWLASSVASLARGECRPFAVCWNSDDGDGQAASRASLRRRGEPTGWHGCFTPSRQPGALGAPWWNHHAIKLNAGSDRCPDSVLPAFENRSYLGHNQSVAVWRGSHHGIASRMKVSAHVPRMRKRHAHAAACTRSRGDAFAAQLLQFSIAHPDLVDAKTSTEGGGAATHTIRRGAMMRGFQMVVVVEGHGAAFRLTDHLAAGQVVLLRTAAGRLRDWAASRANNDTAARSELPWVEWFYPLMRPWVDYVPWSRDDDLRRALVRLQKSRGVRPSICRVVLPMTPLT